MLRYTDRAPPGCHPNPSPRRDVAGAGCPRTPAGTGNRSRSAALTLSATMQHHQLPESRKSQNDTRHGPKWLPITRERAAPYVRDLTTGKDYWRGSLAGRGVDDFNADGREGASEAKAEVT